MAEGYIIENVVGNAGTRYHRYLSPTTQRMKQFVAGMRVLPGGKLPLTEEVFRREMAAIKKAILAGTFVLYTPDRMKITSTHTGEFILVRSDGATKMLPRGEDPECFWTESAKPIPAPEPPMPEPSPVVVQESDLIPEREVQVVEAREVGRIPPELMTSAPEEQPVEEHKKSKKRR